MEIQPNLNATRVGPTQAARPAVRSARTAEDKASFSAATALDQALQNTPAQRVDVVEKAKRLVGDPTYPPRETLQKIATLLAMHWDQETKAQEQ